jgi:hypothetical protein
MSLWPQVTRHYMTVSLHSSVYVLLADPNHYRFHLASPPFLVESADSEQKIVMVKVNKEIL